MDLRQLALARIPSAARQEAEIVVDLLVDGYKAPEIAERLGINRQRVYDVRNRFRAGVVEALITDGYSEVEAIRYLAVPTAIAHAQFKHLSNSLPDKPSPPSET